MSCKGILFALELGLLSLKEKSTIRQRIEAAGGSIAAIITASVRVVITTSAVQTAGSYKLNSAKDLGIPIFLVEDLDEVLAFPPPPRTVTASPSRITASRIGRASVEKSPLIVWDDVPDISGPSDSLPSSNVEVGAFTAFGATDAEDEVVFGADFGTDFDFCPADAAPSHRAVSAPLASFDANSVTAVEDDDDELAIFGFDFGDDFSTVAVPKVPQPQPQLSAREMLDKKLLELSKNLSPESFKSLTSGTSRPSRTSKASRIGYTSAKDTTLLGGKADTEALKGETSVQKRTSEAMTARAAKYLEITSKSATPLVVAPIQLSQLTFTPLTFDLKPASTKPIVPRFGVSSRSSTSSDPYPLVFETLLPSEKKEETEETSINGSLCSSSSRISVHSLSEKDDSQSSTHSSPDDWDVNDQGFGLESPLVDENVYDELDDSLDNEDDADETLFSHSAPVVATTPMKRQKVRRPRVYIDRRTGVMWQRKNTKSLQPHSKLVLESANGVTRVMKLNESTEIVLVSPTPSPVVIATPSRPNKAVGPSTVQPFNAASLEEYGPPLPRKASTLVVHKVITGKASPKFSWVDIVTGKASTTKRVPAMDGLKLFVSGISFDDLTLLGQPREAQLPGYKAEHLKKVKEKNEKSLRKLRKKAKKLSLQKATANEDGSLVPADASRVTIPKRGTGLERMKTDEQLLNEIVVWSQKRVEAAIALRKNFYRAIFTRFGELSAFKPEWERGYIHVTYKSTTSARACLRALKDFDLRNACIRSLRENNLKTPDVKQALPSPSFYVRWTTCYQRKLDNKTKKVTQKKQQDMDAAIAKHAAQAASDVSKIPSGIETKDYF